jgi:hypothetical protein
MTELDRMKLDVEAKDKEIATLKAEVAKLNTGMLAERQERELQSIAGASNIKAKFMRMVSRDLAEHYSGLPRREQIRFDRKQVERWVKAYAKENPEIVTPPPAAPAAAAPAVEPPKPAPRAPVRKPVGAPPAKVPPPAPPPAQRAAGDPAVDPVTGKTPLPNRPNSMNRKELAEYTKRVLHKH